MKASERLINAEFSLKVFRLYNEKKASICVCFYNCEIKDGYFLKTSFGIGDTFEDACEDYLAQIQGKTLVFDAYGNRREVEII